MCSISYTVTDPDLTSSSFILKEVIGRPSCNMRLALSRRRVELQEHVGHGLIQLHDGGLIATSVAIVGRAEDSHYILVVAPVVAFHYKLMSTGNQGQPVYMVEMIRNILPECVASTAGRWSEANSVVRIGPQQVAHGTVVGHLSNAIELPYLI